VGLSELRTQTRVWRSLINHIIDEGVSRPMLAIVWLAHYIFAICTDSASYEGLFSAFGKILTKA
jgi:hypothetical protein